MIWVTADRQKSTGWFFAGKEGDPCPYLASNSQELLFEIQKITEAEAIAA
jgi:hypothetical protein